MTVDVMAQLAIGQQFADAATTGPLMIGILAAAAAGLISFASPCVVPLVPGYMSYLASVVVVEVDYDAEGGTVVTKRQWAVAGAVGLFILGFTIVFVLATVTGGVPRVVDTALVSIYCAVKRRVQCTVQWLKIGLSDKMCAFLDMDSRSCLGLRRDSAR